MIHDYTSAFIRGTYWTKASQLLCFSPPRGVILRFSGAIPSDIFSFWGCKMDLNDLLTCPSMHICNSISCLGQISATALETMPCIGLGSEFVKDMMQSHVVVKNCHGNPNFGMKSNGCRSKNQEKQWLRCTVCHLPFVSLCRKTLVFIRTFHWSCFATSATHTESLAGACVPWRCWSRTCVYFLCYACPMAEKVTDFPCGVLHSLFETLASDNLFALLTTQFLQIAKHMYTDFISSCLPSMYFWSFGWI